MAWQEAPVVGRLNPIGAVLQCRGQGWIPRPAILQFPAKAEEPDANAPSSLKQRTLVTSSQVRSVQEDICTRQASTV